MSKAVLTWDCDINLERLNFREDLTPINQMWTMNLMFGQLASGSGAQPFETVEDYNNWLKRVDSYLEWLQTAEDRMKEGITVGHVLPKSLIKKVVPQLSSLADAEVKDHLFYQPIKNLPEGFSEEDKESLTTSYTDMVENKIIPAYKKIRDFMST